MQVCVFWFRHLLLRPVRKRDDLFLVTFERGLMTKFPVKEIVNVTFSNRALLFLTYFLCFFARDSKGDDRTDDIMTTLNPSHNIFRRSSGRHAQAVHRASPDRSELDDEKSGHSSFPNDLPLSSNDSDLGPDESLRAERRSRSEGRKRVKGAMPPMPDLRFEQVSCRYRESASTND